MTHSFGSAILFSRLLTSDSSLAVSLSFVTSISDSHALSFEPGRGSRFV